MFRRKKPTEEVLIARASVMKLEPGDCLVLHSDHPLSVAQMDRLRKNLIYLLPDHANVVVLDRGLELEVVRPVKQDQAKSAIAEWDDQFGAPTRRA